MEIFKTIESSTLMIQSPPSEELVHDAIPATVFIRYSRRVCGNNLRSRQGEHTRTIKHRGHQYCKPSRQDKASLGTVVWSIANFDNPKVR
jgi:hypothetical protein